MRRWQKAERLCEGLVEDLNVVDGRSQTVKFHLERHLVEECWVEAMKNLNEWAKIYELAINTERRDLLVESAYYMHKPSMMDNLSVGCLDSHNPLTYIYYMSIWLIDPQWKNEVLPKQFTKELKQLLYVSLINKCHILPRPFSELHKHLLQVTNFCLEFEEGWDLVQYTRKHKDAKEVPKIKEEIRYLALVNRERIPHFSMGLAQCKKTFEQRNIISHVLNNRMEELVKDKMTMLDLQPNT